MSNTGIKVVKDGYDVATATLLQQTFNSEKNCLKIAAEGTLTYSGAGDGSVTYSHGLGYIPAWLAWFQVSSSNKWFLQGIQEHLSGKSVIVNARTTSTELIADIYNNTGSAVDIRYVLFVDPGN